MVANSSESEEGTVILLPMAGVVTILAANCAFCDSLVFVIGNVRPVKLRQIVSYFRHWPGCLATGGY